MAVVILNVSQSYY